MMVIMSPTEVYMAVMIDYKTPSPTLTREIGRVVIRHSHLDHELRLTIKSLLRIKIDDPIYQSETDMLSGKLRARIKELAATELAGKPDVHTELTDWLDRSEKLSELRNQLVHGVWSRSKTDGSIKVRDTRFGKLLKMPTVKELKVAEAAMLKLLTELNRSRLKGKLKQALSTAD